MPAHRCPCPTLIRFRASRAWAVKSCASWPKVVIEMSRVAKKPIALPKVVELNVQAESVSVKGPKGTLSIAKPADVDVKIENGQAQLSTSDAEKVAITGTLRAIIANMVHGVSEGFERKLELVGVGYRAAVQGKDLNLSLGFSSSEEHPSELQSLI